MTTLTSKNLAVIVAVTRHVRRTLQVLHVIGRGLLSYSTPRALTFQQYDYLTLAYNADLYFVYKICYTITSVIVANFRRFVKKGEGNLLRF